MSEKELSEKEMSEEKQLLEKKEEELPKEIKPSLAEKVKALELSLKEFKKDSAVKIAELKAKLDESKKKSLELYEKIKATSTLKLEGLKGQYAKLKAKFKRKEKPKPSKRILCYECGDTIGYMRGYVTHHKSGFFIVEEAEFVDYSTSGEPIVLSYLGSACINEDHVVMWF